MSEQARLRRELRPHVATAAPCRGCVFFEECGGIQPARPLLGCFDLACCGDGRCDNVCPYHPEFMKRLAEVGGIHSRETGRIEQSPLPVPRYVPMIHHGYRRRGPLPSPVVALDTYKVLRLEAGEYRAATEDGVQLRMAFGLAPDARVILRGTAEDRHLERYWSHRRRDRVPEQMARLGVSLVIAPNYSHFLDVPRTDNLYNRRRQLVCLEEFARAGLSPVPHLNAVTPGDWDFWRSYLAANGSITYVAKEFQTGNKDPKRGQEALDRMSSIQDAVGRRLHPILIGGAQFVEAAAVRFGEYTVIDSTPFLKAVQRLAFDGSVGKDPWKKAPTPLDQHIDEIMAGNITGYERWIERRSSAEKVA